MTSQALQRWCSQSSAELDTFEATHARVRVGAGGRSVSALVIQSYVVLLTSRFQLFCRDLHSEAVDALASAQPNRLMANVVRKSLLTKRSLDWSNPKPETLGEDFGRMALPLWDVVDPPERRLRAALATLNTWRNAVAHHDFTKVKRQVPLLDDVRSWRRSCDHVASATGQRPW